MFTPLPVTIFLCQRQITGFVQPGPKFFPGAEKAIAESKVTISTQASSLSNRKSVRSGIIGID